MAKGVSGGRCGQGEDFGLCPQSNEKSGEESKHESDVLNLGITRVYSDYTVENRLRETRVNAEGLVRNLMR